MCHLFGAAKLTLQSSGDINAFHLSPPSSPALPFKLPHPLPRFSLHSPLSRSYSPPLYSCPPPHRYSINFSFGGTWRALLEISEVPYTLRCETTKIIFHDLFLQEKTKVVTPLEAIRVTFADGGKSPSLTPTFNLKLKKYKLL